MTTSSNEISQSNTTPPQDTGLESITDIFQQSRQCQVPNAPPLSNSSL